MAWAAIDSLYGDAGDDLKRWTLIIWEPGQGPVPQLQAPQLLVDVNVNWTAPVPLDTEDISRRLMARAADALHWQIPERRVTVFHRWLDPIPASMGKRWLSDAYVELVTNSAHSTHECFAGAIDRCRVALGVPLDDDPATRWPTASDRLDIVQLIVRQHGYLLQRRQDLAQPCLDHSDESCIATLRVLSQEWLPDLTTQQTRSTLFRHAVRLGGRQGYRRLLQTHDQPLGAALAAASPAFFAPFKGLGSVTAG